MTAGEEVDMDLPELPSLRRRSACVPLLRLAAGRIGQVGLVVRDLEAAAGRWSHVHDPSGATERTGTGSLDDPSAPGGSRGHGDLGRAWKVWSYSPQTLSSQTFRGAPASFSMRIALYGENPQIELIEPLDGPSLYDEWLSMGNPGVQHLGFHVPSLQAAIAAMSEAGFALLQSGVGTGADGTGGFAYFDTYTHLGFIAEAIEKPVLRRPPERIIPIAADSSP